MSDSIPKAVVTESNGEISCSVEETNRIRALLGLKPLRGVGTSGASNSSASKSSEAPSGDVKAAVTESNGEISCSIEETNRIRALLGLKPLKLEGSDGSSSVLSKEARSVENFHRQKEEEQKAREEQELRERLEDAKARRYVQTKFESRSLGEVGGDADETKLLSAAEWASRSRAKELAEKERKKREAEEAARRLEEEERLLLAGGGGKKPNYNAADLKGLQVQHSVDDFNAGETVILTLADTSILQRNEHGKIIGVNEEVDVLENVNMTEEERRKLNDKIKKRAKMPVYSGYDDAEFAEGAAPGSRPNILSHYDKEPTLLRPKMVLEEGGLVVTSSSSDNFTAPLGVKFDVAEIKHLDDTLGSDSKTMSDYLTPAEYASFNKPKKEKKMRKIRKKDREESSYAELVDAAQEEGAADRGSRSRAGAGGVAATVAATDAERRDAYNLALQKAQSASDKVYSETAKKYTKPVIEEAGDDDDLQVALALSRAKNIASQKSREQNGVEAESKDDSNGLFQRADIAAIAIKNAVGDEAAAQILQKKMPRATVKASTEEGIFDIDAEGRTVDGTLVFSDTTEFTSRLQARLNERVRDQADSAVRELASRKRAAEEDEALEGMMEVDENQEESEEEHEEDYDEQLGLLQQKPIASKGLAATLALLKNSGDLKPREELAGRTKDVRDIDPSSNDFGVKLEYRDEFGRKLTQKEAFRQLSYKFHGFGPQQKKQEKRLKALAASSKAASSKGSIDVGTMKSLVKAQEATGKAHVTIQGGIHASEDTIRMLAESKLKNTKKHDK